MRIKNQKYLLTRLLVSIALVTVLTPAMAQRILNTPLTGPLTVQDGTSITLSPGFSTNGFTFLASIGVPYVDVTPSSDKNYIISTTFNAATASGVVTQAADLHREIQYFDGLGRPMQSVSVQASPTGKDIVTPIRYDDFGRESTKYLPFAGANNNGLFVGNDLAGQSAFYTVAYGADGPNAFAITKFEPSPLNRVLKQGAPGATWQPDEAAVTNDHSVKLGYGTNIATDNVRMWTVNSDGLPTGSAYYPVNTLYKTTTWDENNPNDLATTTSRTEDFKDLQGKVVLKRSYKGATATTVAETLSTYYVYDDFELLRVVIPPLANGEGGNVTAVLNDLCYQYTYDARKRMKEKKLPGVGWTYMVYDQRDRLVAAQDPEMRTAIPANGKWLITKYDQLNRPVMTALKALGDDRGTLQAYFNDYPSSLSYYETRDGSNVGYTTGDSFNPKLNLTESNLLTVTYYDTYDYSGVKPFLYNSEIGNNSFSGTKGLVTGTKTKVLETTTFLTSTNYYDDRYRVIQTLRDIYTPDAIYSEVASTMYDFPGKVKQTKQSQTVNSVTTTVDKFYTYDHAGRLSKTEQQIAGDANGKVTVAQNSYNEIGQLIDKKLHKTNSYDYLQSVDYTYNIRGWLTSINNPDNPSQSGDLNADLFGEKLIYQTPEPELSNLSQYNGNISAMVWKSTDKTEQGYAFTYDGLNRLTFGDHKDYNSGWVDNNNYEEKSLAYDMNGNIKRMIRTNSFASEIANYTYTYSGNKLSSINGGTAYSYDQNGNTTLDGLRGVGISYNILNLPKLVSKGADNIAYIYSAAGEKLAKKMTNNTYQYYAGNMVYNNDKSLKYLLFDEGLVNKVSGGYAYEYHLKDHLGNTRVTFQPNGSTTTTTQVAEYYPFGSSYLPISPAGSNKYLYNGKEKQDDVLGGTALDWYDYGARFYDPVGKLGWLSVDPLAEKMTFISPYSYCFNNPLKFKDVDGLYPVVTITKKVVGTTTQRVIGYTGSNNVQYTKVNLYRAVITDTEDKNYRKTFAVTRDAFAVKKGDAKDGKMKMTNVAFEPKDGNVNHYTGKVMPNGYPEGNGTKALKLTQSGSEVVHADANQASVELGYRTKADVASGVMIHVGGTYNHSDGTQSVAASEGCFGITQGNNSSSNPSNDYSNSVIGDIIDRANNSESNPGKIEVVIEKRSKSETTTTKTQEQQ